MFQSVYKLIMDSRYNPLVNIQKVATRHLVMQMLAWMWCTSSQCGWVQCYYLVSAQLLFNFDCWGVYHNINL